MEESPHLNHQCELILGKIRKSTTPPGWIIFEPNRGAVGYGYSESDAIYATKNGITRLKERAEDNKTLSRFLGPSRLSSKTFS